MISLKHYNLKFQFVPALSKGAVYLKDELNYLYRVRNTQAAGGGGQRKVRNMNM